MRIAQKIPGVLLSEKPESKPDDGDGANEKKVPKNGTGDTLE